MTSILARPEGLMIKDAEIRNFRCFDTAKLKGCRTINVVLGKNASGKTALLEALFLALGGSAEIAQRLRGWRGLGGLVTQDPAADQLIWGDLFHGFDLKKKVSITLKGDPHQERALTISYKLEEGFSPIPDAGKSGLIASPIRFEYKRPDKKFTVYAAPAGPQYAYIGAEITPAEAVFFAATSPINQAEIVDRYSRLLKDKAEKEVVAEICSEFPFIKGMEASSQYGIPALLLDVVGSPHRIPLGLVSGGVS